MRHERDSGSKNVMESMPLLPLRVASQNSLIPTPLGLIAPNPVTTTRRRFGWPLFSFILTLHTAKCFTASIASGEASVKADWRERNRAAKDERDSVGRIKMNFQDRVVLITGASSGI